VSAGPRGASGRTAAPKPGRLKPGRPKPSQPKPSQPKPGRHTFGRPHPAQPEGEWSNSPRHESARAQPARPPRAEPDVDRSGVDRPGFDREEGQAGQRRPLSHVGGRIEHLVGPAELTDVIRRCLSVHPERGVRDHVHGFHSYPARLHPGTAARLIEALAPEGGQVADPFCGCGTVLVEARRLGRSALGLDLNPLAVRLTRFKTHPLDAELRDALLEAAVRVAEGAEDRRAETAGPTRPYEPEEREEFDIHVLLELDGLAHGIRKEPTGPIRQALLLALSSIFSKVARQPTAASGHKRLASGFTIRFFVGRVDELVRQLAEYEALLRPDAPEAQCKEGDARQLERLAWRNVDLVISSPPYPGVLDYADYHRTRLRWLGLDGANLERQELGARRSLQRLDPEEAAQRWEQDFTQVLSAVRRTLAPGGRVALVLADSMLAGQPYPADEVVERCGTQAGLRMIARGSQRRPHFHADSARAFGRRPRYEHLLLLGAAKGAADQAAGNQAQRTAGGQIPSDPAPAERPRRRRISPRNTSSAR
jgi:SAM-dependent methyltransferase